MDDALHAGFEAQIPIYLLFEKDVRLSMPHAPYFTFLRDLLLFDSDAGSDERQWLWDFRYVPPQTFFAQTLANTPAGSIIVCQSWHLENREVVPESPYSLQDRARSTPRSWQLWNASQPLIVIVYDAAGCTLSIPLDTHHVVYLASWCERYHRDYLRSMQFESSAFPRPWLRDAPFGTSLHAGSLLALQAERRDALDRRILFSFRGSAPPSKPKRTELMATTRQQRAALAQIAGATMRGRVPPHTSGVGRYLLDIIDNSPEARRRTNGTHLHYETADAISYLELLRSSVFTLSPAGDVWEAYRTWEAMEAGSIPIVQEVPEVYAHCRNASAHLRETMPFLLWVRRWADLPEVLAHELADLQRVRARQQAMLQWLRAYKARFRRELASTSQMMTDGVWSVPSQCAASALDADALAEQHRSLASYWRQPQVAGDGVTMVGWAHDPEPLEFLGETGLCGSAGFREQCVDKGCGMPLVAKFGCELGGGDRSLSAHTAGVASHA